MAERTTIFAYSVLSCFISGIPFSLAVRWTWGGGWLNRLGFHDFAGASVVHVVGGASAIAGVFAVGPRDGRYDPRRFYEFMPHDVSAVMSGSLVLWVGWYGFNMGSVSSLESLESAHAAANSAVTTTVSGSTGALTAVLLSLMRAAAIGGRTVSVDAISLANGLLSGLVAITAASDIVTVYDSALIGIGSAGAYMFASALSEAFYLDDVVEAGAVHAGCGAWGTIAAGLFHRDRGLFRTGNWMFLAIQLIGIISIAAVAFTTTLVAALVLNHWGLLRVDPEDEAKGLDHKFGIAASSFHYDRAERIRSCATVIESSGGSISTLIEALQGIKNHIILPFNPQASDMVLDGQVIDALSRMDVSFAPTPTGGAGDQGTPAHHSYNTSSPLRNRLANALGTNRNTKDYTREMSRSGFNESVHGASKLERIFARSVAEAPAGATAQHTPAVAPPTSSRADGARVPRFSAPSAADNNLTQKAAGFASTVDEGARQTKSTKWLAFLSHHKQDGGDAARVFVDTARRVFNAPDGGATLAAISSSLQDDLIFLDSSNLSDLRRLLDHVEESANYILMLTRSTLERPWVLAELVRAHKCRKPMLIISATWPGDDSSPQGRGFKYPSHLDEAIDEWQEFYYESTLRSRAMSEASERHNRLEKMLAGSILFQRVKAKVAEWLRSQQERPANASTWLPERWAGLGNALHRSSVSITQAFTSFHFKPLLAENEA